jgi:hypothetical protein
MIYTEVQLTAVQPHEIGYPGTTIQITLTVDSVWTYVYVGLSHYGKTIN